MSAGPDVTPAPATMTVFGRQFLQALASRATSGCFLEIGPLFGSSTQAIASGRRTGAPIHTIDTFEPAPWVKRRVGRDLSREAFDEYTRHIPRLVVHEGFSPDVVRESWRDPIGFYFDDATHGDPGWSDNFDFFSQFFTDDAIACGDDFAGGWPDIPRNVTRIAESWGAGLYVIGRVWAITRRAEHRIVAAADDVFPELIGATIESSHGTGSDTKPASCWSRGLHEPAPLRWFRCAGEPVSAIGFVTYADDGAVIGTWEPGEPVELEGASAILMSGRDDIGVQFCVAGPPRSDLGAGDPRTPRRTENTRTLRAGTTFEVPPMSAIVAIRLTSHS